MKELPQDIEDFIRYVLENEKKISGKEEENIIDYLRNCYRLMKNSLKKALDNKITSFSGMIKNDGKKLYNSSGIYDFFSSSLTKAISYAIILTEYNASGGEIVACPTAGSCGIVPGILIALEEEKDFEEEVLIKSLLVAGGIAQLMSKKVEFSGAMFGCQAEIGVASAMGASIITYLYKGNTKQVLNAASFVLKSCIGLVCDPVAGLVEVPCIKRNGMYVALSFAAAFMALSGVDSVIPFDEIVETIVKVGRQIPPELKETGKGGLGSSPTSCKVWETLKKIRKEFLHTINQDKQ